VKEIFASFFARHFSRQIKELYSATVILSLAVASVNIFEPIFLFSLFVEQYGTHTSLKAVLLFYLLVYVIYFFIMPLGAKVALRFGYEYAIGFASLVTVGFYLSLFVAQDQPWFLAISVLMYAISKTLYWPAYHSNFARFSADGEQGRQISIMTALLSMTQIVGPLLGGLIISWYGFSALFIVVSILVIVSNIPMLITREQFIATKFSYIDAYRRLFSRENRRKFVAYLGYGEELISDIIWPIFIFIVVKDFLGLGFLVAISVLVTTLIVMYIGRATDTTEHGTLKYGLVIYTLAWLWRLIARSAPTVLLVDVMARISKQAISIPITALTYEYAQDTSVMKTIMLFEMSLVFGKILAAITCLLVLSIFNPGWNMLFIVGALFAMLYSLFSPKLFGKS
jgi:MFS family permease